MEGPEQDPCLRLAGLSCSPHEMPPAPFFMPQGGLMLYGGLGETGNLLAMLFPEGAYDEGILGEILDDVVALIDRG